MKIESESFDLQDIRVVPKRSTISSRKDVDITRTFRFFHSPREWTGVPIMCANMVPIATKAMANALAKKKCITVLHKYYSTRDLLDILEVTEDDSPGLHYAWLSIGYKDSFTKLCAVRDKFGCDPNIVIDVPNGYMEKFVVYCASVRRAFPDAIIAAGNVTTPEMVQELIIHGGVDIVKTQIGPGSQCETRKVTGVGYGTACCIDKCSNAAHGLTTGDGKLGLIISDGGCKEYGDICKSFCLGADFVMIGGMFAGTEECEGDWVLEGGIKYKFVPETIRDHPCFGEGFDISGIPISFDGTRPCSYWNTYDESLDGTWKVPPTKTKLTFYGMSTHHAQEKHSEGKKDYRASEGKVTEIDYKGEVKDILQEMLGGMRSCGAYIGATKLEYFSRCATFVRVYR